MPSIKKQKKTTQNLQLVIRQIVKEELEKALQHNHKRLVMRKDNKAVNPQNKMLHNFTSSLLNNLINSI